MKPSKLYDALHALIGGPVVIPVFTIESTNLIEWLDTDPAPLNARGFDQ
jgi:hypothetical protein